MMAKEQEKEQAADKPMKTDEGWHEYVMGHFSEDELVNGNPKYVGLRRVFEKLYAKILRVDNTVIKPPLGDDLSATVTCALECREYDGGEVIMQSSSADVCMANTSDPFYKYAVSTAETRAEGRTLRKLLGIKTITAEEAMIGDAECQTVSEQGIRGILNISKKIDIDMDKFLAREAGVNRAILEKNPKMITAEQSQRILAKLNEYMDKGVPADLSVGGTS